MEDRLKKRRKNLCLIMASYKAAVIIVPLVIFVALFLTSDNLLSLPTVLGIASSYAAFLSAAFLKVSSETVLETEKSLKEVREEFESEKNPIYVLFQPREMKIRGRKFVQYGAKKISYNEKGDTIRFSQEGEVSSSYEVSLEKIENGTKVVIDNSSEPYTANKMLVQVIRSRYVFSAIQSKGYNIVSGHESLGILRPSKWELDREPLEF